MGIGAALTGVISVVQTHLQRRSQNDALVHQARVQEESEWRRFRTERWKWHAELRRQSYIDCLISIERCSGFFGFSEKASESLITEEGSTPGPWINEVPPEEFISQFNRQMSDETFDRIQVVRLDGPEDISAHGRKLLGSLLNYWVASQEVASDRTESKPRSREDHDRFLAIFQEFRDDITKFIALASASLDQQPWPEKSLDTSNTCKQSILIAADEGDRASIPPTRGNMVPINHQHIALRLNSRRWNLRQ